MVLRSGAHHPGRPSEHLRGRDRGTEGTLRSRGTETLGKGKVRRHRPQREAGVRGPTRSHLRAQTTPSSGPASCTQVQCPPGLGGDAWPCPSVSPEGSHYTLNISYSEGSLPETSSVPIAATMPSNAKCFLVQPPSIQGTVPRVLLPAPVGTSQGHLHKGWGRPRARPRPVSRATFQALAWAGACEPDRRSQACPCSQVSPRHLPPSPAPSVPSRCFLCVTGSRGLDVQETLTVG